MKARAVIITPLEVEKLYEANLLNDFGANIQKKYINILLQQKKSSESRVDLEKMSTAEKHSFLRQNEKYLPPASEKQQSILSDMIQRDEIGNSYCSRLKDLSMYEAHVMIEAVLYARQNNAKYPLDCEQRGKLLYCIDHGYISELKPEDVIQKGYKTVDAVLSQIEWECYQNVINPDGSINDSKCEGTFREIDAIAKAGRSISEPQKYALNKLLDHGVLNSDDLNGMEISSLSSYEAQKLISMGKQRENVSPELGSDTFITEKQKFAIMMLLEQKFLCSREIGKEIAALSKKEAQILISTGKTRESEMIIR